MSFKDEDKKCESNDNRALCKELSSLKSLSNTNFWTVMGIVIVLIVITIPLLVYTVSSIGHLYKQIKKNTPSKLLSDIKVDNADYGNFLEQNPLKFTDFLG